MVLSKNTDENKAGKSGGITDLLWGTLKKLLLLIIIILAFSIYNQAFIPHTEPQTQYLNQIFTGQIGVVQGLKMTIIQGIEFGTQNFPQFLHRTFMHFSNGQPIDAGFLGLLPAFLVFMIFLLPVTTFFDFIDQRHHAETSYIIQILTTIIIIVLASLMINGYYFFHDLRTNVECDNLYTFQKNNQTYLKCDIGGINQTVTPPQYTNYTLKTDSFQRNTGNQTEIPFLDSGNQTGG
ncbi:hypothetical protein AKJ56_00405 [candidate division MSBL1 archaeon SCGC-AAA382N08]|uniref:Uncharacterized protein n=1 Tax=candidate division MSBL1 archaeon SCGC-AAA382N08 TaxID=1698285 RepID=A0A133VQP6_9EURY|nr:hypothetical protein AKJ56_00405 [candidate division MSBL1 archaeon SCGC-AAA382N08]